MVPISMPPSSHCCSKPWRRWTEAAPLLAGMARFHLGYGERDLRPLEPRAVDRGKRMRPAVVLLAAQAAVEIPPLPRQSARPDGAAAQFHADSRRCAGRGPTRRHRPTVWSIWGIGQAINAGDALFAAAHFAVVPTGIKRGFRRAYASSPGSVRPHDDRYRRGRALDLGFESRPDVLPSGTCG